MQRWRAAVASFLIGSLAIGCGSTPSGDIVPITFPPGDCTSDPNGAVCAKTEPVVASDVIPPPLAGGTLLVAADGRRAVVSDPDRDRVLVVDLVTGTVLATVATPAGAQPGRATEDADGRFYVVLREAGAILTITPGGTSSLPVCDAPRGIAYGAAGTALFVVCAGGKLVRLGVGDTPSIEAVTVLGPDLRDVVASATKLFVSHFRTAEVETVSFDGVVLGSDVPASYLPAGLPTTFTPDVAWRMVAFPGGGVFVVHQEALASGVPTSKSGNFDYAGGGCPLDSVHAAITRFDDAGHRAQDPSAGGFVALTVPVDVAVASDGSLVAVVGAGTRNVLIATPSDLTDHDGCAELTRGTPAAPVESDFEPVAAAFDGSGELVIQTREPSTLEVFDANGTSKRSIALGGPSRADTGFTMFHGNPDAAETRMSIACASCHPEGREDGHVWAFPNVGLRRTMSLGSDVTQRAPFHWSGDLPDIEHLVSEVFGGRMHGAPQSSGRVEALRRYLASFPPLPLLDGVNAAAVARGRAVFESPSTSSSGWWSHQTAGSRAEERSSSHLPRGARRATAAPSSRRTRSRASAPEGGSRFHPFSVSGCALPISTMAPRRPFAIASGPSGVATATGSHRTSARDRSTILSPISLRSDRSRNRCAKANSVRDAGRLSGGAHALGGRLTWLGAKVR